MGATTIVAIYAAAVATIGVGWQMYSQMRSHRTRLELSIAGMFDGAPSSETHQVVVHVVNHSVHDVPMPAVNVEQRATGLLWPIRDQDVLDELPEILGARAGVTLRVRADRFERIDFAQPAVASAATATGERFRSRPTVIGHLLD